MSFSRHDFESTTVNRCSYSSLSVPSVISLHTAEARLLFIAVLSCVVMPSPILLLNMGGTLRRFVREVLWNTFFVIHSTWTCSSPSKSSFCAATFKSSLGIPHKDRFMSAYMDSIHGFNSGLSQLAVRVSEVSYLTSDAGTVVMRAPFL